MAHTLIVARMKPGAEDAVRAIFAESDQTELPRMLGVRQRSLFSFHGLYFHLIESGEEVAGPLEQVRGHPLFQDIDTRLAEHIGAYDPETWRSPRDAMARQFYHWTRR